MITSKFCLSASIPYNKWIHGIFEQSYFNSPEDWNIIQHGFITMFIIPIDEFYDKEIFNCWKKYAKMLGIISSNTIMGKYVRDEEQLVIARRQRDSFNESHQTQPPHMVRYALSVTKYLQKRYHVNIVENVYLQRCRQERVGNNTDVDCDHKGDDCECVATCIIKTHYIRLIQRKWKRLYKEMMSRRISPSSIRYREIHGRWATNCLRVIRF